MQAVLQKNNWNDKFSLKEVKNLDNQLETFERLKILNK